MEELWAAMTIPNLVSVISFIAAFLALIRAYLVERSKGRSVHEAVLLAVNGLKDEHKLVNGKFTPAMLKKLEEFAEVLEVGEEARKAVVDIIVAGKEGKYGKYKNKPIFNSDV